MSANVENIGSLAAENESLKARLEEAEELLRAIRSGEVDALVVGEQIYSLESSDAASSRFRGEVLSQVTEAVIATDNDGRIIYINDAAERQYGIDTGTVLGSLQDEAFHLRWFSEADRRAAENALRKKGYWRGENIHVKNDGSEFYAESTISLRRGDDGEVAGQLSVIRDVSIRKKAEEQLRRNHETFFNLVKNAPLGIYVVDADFRLIQVSAGSRKVFSFVDPLIGRDFEEVMRIVWAEPFASEAIAHFRHTLETGEPYRGADTTERRGDIDDEESYDWKIERITLPDGRFGVVCYFYDLTERKQFEQKIRESEERLSLVVESAKDYSIITMDPDGSVTGWNSGAELMFGYTADEMIGKSSEILFTPEDRKDRIHEKELVEARATGRFEDDRWHLRKDGSRFFAQGVTTPFADKGVAGFVKISRDLTMRMEAEAAVHKQDMLRRLVQSQEDERHRIARDLHDHLGQQMTVLRLSLGTLHESCGDDPKVQKQIVELQARAAQIDSDVGFLAFELRPTALDDLGLAAALENYIQEWSRNFQIAADFHALRMGEKRLVPEIETHVYRIAQEALNNTSKHSQATSVNVILERRTTSVVLIVEDDGVGFDPTQRVSDDGSRRGIGLTGMQERAEMVGGLLEVESRPGSGTTVFARFPARFDTDGNSDLR